MKAPFLYQKVVAFPSFCFQVLRDKLGDVTVHGKKRSQTGEETFLTATSNRWDTPTEWFICDDQVDRNYWRLHDGCLVY